MSSETKYLNSEYKDFFERSLSDADPALFKACLLYTSDAADE